MFGEMMFYCYFGTSVTMTVSIKQNKKYQFNRRVLLERCHDDADGQRKPRKFMASKTMYNLSRVELFDFNFSITDTF